MSDREEATSAVGPRWPRIVDARIVLAARPDGGEDIWSVLV
jgi:hypothetical protein